MNPLNSDTDGDGYSDYQEVQWGSNANSASSFPNYAISGSVSYDGPQIGTIHVILSTNSDGSGLVQSQTMSEPGTYTFNNVPAWRTYNVSAWRDSNGNSSRDSWEAQGSSSANQVYLSGNVGSVNVTLSDPDTDSDSLPDWWEIVWFGNLNQVSTGDPDEDGKSNQQEYHFDTDPTVVTITIGNAALVDAPNNPRIADTSMFFPNSGYSNDISNYSSYYDGDTGQNSVTDTCYASSFAYFRPNYNQTVASYQANYNNWLGTVTTGAGSKSAFLEVDVLYDDFNWDDGHSDLNDPYLEEHAADRGLTLEFLDTMKDFHIYPVFILLNGPDTFYTNTSLTITNIDMTTTNINMPARVAAHARMFINSLYENGVYAAYVLGCETPGQDFHIGEAENLISLIKTQIMNDYSDATLRDIPLGVHAQLDQGCPGNADFLAYEFGWNPWEGWKHGAGEQSTNNVVLMNFYNDAKQIMDNYGVAGTSLEGSPGGVFLLEYNVRVTDEAATNQTWVLDVADAFRFYQSNGKCCRGVSRSYPR